MEVSLWGSPDPDDAESLPLVAAGPEFEAVGALATTWPLDDAGLERAGTT